MTFFLKETLWISEYHISVEEIREISRNLRNDPINFVDLSVSETFEETHRFCVGVEDIGSYVVA
jgi:hypothetical protein